jgi:hypothetical protein
LNRQLPGWRKCHQIHVIDCDGEQDQSERCQECHAIIRPAPEDHGTNREGDDQKDQSEQDTVPRVEVKREANNLMVLHTSARRQLSTKIGGMSAIEEVMKRGKVRRDASEGESEYQDHHDDPTDPRKDEDTAM